MHLSDVYADRFGLSFEMFPPKTPAGDEALRVELARLAEYDPAFVSCTYGAGGSTRDRTLDWCRELKSDFGQNVTAHFTCVGSATGDMAEWLDAAQEAGVSNIMALRGDLPEGGPDDAPWQPPAGGFRYANELVAFVRERFPEFGVGVAGYPEKHPECGDPETDLANLKRKVDAGADAVFTQLFFENDHFLRFRDACGEIGVDVPIVPGVMPVTDFARIKRITAMCGSTFPRKFSAALEAVKDDPVGQFEIGVDWAVNQCRGLMEEGVPGMHFYVLNKAAATEQILDGMNLAPVRA
ncbi:methylenetetrahydrofolate reductase [NAD(P)H] [Alienimonas californiensis]|uniref:Methylenetetrahydrofolate reductase n=1 Tax=Alienimonas californiensis TaxID=2527989 RepID=A0A517P3X2_9PLAN|nr:methylenetetrahydrofolate reductase [NAD(P)H] [Alienimonas californiensis]QDT14077.1 5,10-methylenetetrahydrofolate reductase [Alienimonas californiensis]